MGKKSKFHYVRLFVFFLFMTMFVFSVFAQATSQNTMTLYGQLFDTTGDPALGAHTITVTIYDASTSGNALFNEEHNVTVMADGTYTVIIGDGFAPGSAVATGGIPASVFSNDSWFLGIKVDTDDEMTPRIRITSAPYAISAGQLGGLDASDYVTKTELDGEGFLKNEADPIYAGAPASNITDAGSGSVTTSAERTNWNAAYGWGNHATAGYRTTGDNLGNHTATSTLNMNSNYIYNSGSGYSGDVAFNDDVIPRSNGSYNLGTSSYRWGQLHVNGIYLNGSLRTSWPSSGVTGSGSSGRLALWNGSSSLTSSSGINYSGTSIACGASATSNYKVYGYYNSSNYGRLGTNDTGVYGRGSTYGVFGQGVTYGIYGYSPSNYGVFGQGTTYGVYGYSSGNTGVYGRGYTYGIRGEITSSNGYGVYGTGHPYGVYGRCAGGASYGVYGYYDSVNYGYLGSSVYGVYGRSSGYGVYGYGQYGVYGRGSSFGVYSSGNFLASGAKSAVVRTTEGPKAVYCQESPENWFEDFGSGMIQDGKAIVPIAEDFLQTVTINTIYPMKVFITPNANIGNWWVEKDNTGFTLFAPNAKDGAKFDYRVVAKRSGYEDFRLKSEPASYSDHFLYPDLKDVPQKYRLEWVKMLPQGEDGSTNVLNQLTPEQRALLTPEQIEKLKSPKNEASTDNTSNSKSNDN